MSNKYLKFDVFMKTRNAPFGALYRLPRGMKDWGAVTPLRGR
jgi:hypothetical protein